MAHSENVLYVEPNYTWDKSKIGTTSDYKEVAPSLEDMCIVVDLEVEIPSKSYNATQSSDNVTYGFQWTVPNNGKKPNVTFFQGTHFKYTDSKGKSFVSTNAYDYATYEDVLKINTTENGLEYNSTSELFGINSIDIEYNNYMVPVITIKFTDIRGVSLFAPEELRHSTTVDGTSGFINHDIAGSFFKSFFTFPYPKFKLMVKGIYGEPVAYELSCADFRANFEAQTGNFGATAKFIGYSYSLLSDVTLTALLAAPLNHFGGADYWNQKSNLPYEQGGFRLKDGSKMPTLLNVIEKFQELQTELDKYSSYSEEGKRIEDIDAKEKEISDIDRKINDYVRKLIDSNPKCECTTLFDIVYVFDCTNLDGEKFNNCSEFYNTNNLSSRVDICTSNPQLRVDLGKEIKERININIEKCIVYDLRQYREELKTEQEQNIGERLQLQQNLANQRQAVIKKVIGFNPSVENVVRITLAHLETLIYSFNICEDNIKKSPRTYRDLRLNLDDIALLGDGASKSQVGPFPECTRTEKDIYGGEKTEFSWLGNRTQNAPEVNFVNGLLKGVKNIQTALDNVQEYVEHLNRATNVIVNIVSTTDLIASSNPWHCKSLNQNNINDLVKRLALRYTLISQMNKDTVMAKLGELDAYNFLDVYPSLNSDFIELINSQLNVNNITKIITTKTEDENSLFTKDGGNKYQLTDLRRNTLGYTVLPYNSYEWEDLKRVDNDEEMLISDSGSIKLNSNTLTIHENYEEFSLLGNKLDESLKNDLRWKDLSFNPSNYEEAFLSEVDFISTFHSSDDNEVQNIFSDNDVWCVWRDDVNFNTNPHKDGLVYPNCIFYCEEEQVNIEKPTLQFKFSLPQWVLHKHSKKLVCGKDKGSVFNGIRVDTSSKYTIPCLNTTSISPFTCDEFYKITTQGLKALYYLTSWNWWKAYSTFWNQIGHHGEKAIIEMFDYLPKYSVLAIGGLLYLLSKEINNENDTEVFDKIKKRMSLNGVNQKHFDVMSITNLRADVKSTLINKFIIWEANDWIEIYNDLAIFNDNKANFSAITSIMATNDMVLWKDVFNENNMNLKNIYHSYMSASLVDGRVVFWLREDASIVKKIVKDLATPWLLINHLPRIPINSGFSLDITKASVYFKSFINTLKEKIRTNNLNNTSTVITSEADEDIKIGLYRYLKVLWDKWLNGNPDRLNKWSLKEFSKHWYFIDSNYNTIGDKSFINLPELVKDINASLQTHGYNMLSFLFNALNRNKMGLYCVQNFMGMIDEDKMNQMFKPIPYNQIDTSKIDEIPDFVVMQNGEFSSKLDIRGVESKNDSYMIGEYDDIPKAIKTKKAITRLNPNGNGYKIPAFGVTMGKQYQSYFSDIQISMDSPIVTEQSLRAQFNIAKGANRSNFGGETNREIVSLGQDLYSIYANNSYTCNIQMLGCAWIQPLMYFQLNNIPMFRGTYLIQKVSHHIQPGHMVTNFMGTRMAKLSTPLVDHAYMDNQVEQTYDEITPYSKMDKITLNGGELYNGCSYEYFEPRTVDDENVQETDKDKKLAEELIKSLESTISRSDVADILYGVQFKYLGQGICEATLSNIIVQQNGDEEPLSIIFDILVTTYDKLLKKCYWVTNSYTPTAIRFQVTHTENDTDRQFAVTRTANTSYGVNVIPINKESDASIQFFRTLAKRYGPIDNSNKNVFIKECPNFSNWSQTNASWMSEINQIFKQFDFICIHDNFEGNIHTETVVNGTKYSWKGLSNEQEDIEANSIVPKTYQLSGSINVLCAAVERNLSNYQNDKGRCATGVRIALEDAEIIPPLSVRPTSACVYASHLPHWGFKCVYQYISGTKMEFDLQEGDIEVVASCPQHKHGHIAIYNNNRWYADKITRNINPYGDKGRPIKIFRYTLDKDKNS